jgi:hypothetical protein
MKKITSYLLALIPALSIVGCAQVTPTRDYNYQLNNVRSSASESYQSNNASVIKGDEEKNEVVDNKEVKINPVKVVQIGEDKILPKSKINPDPNVQLIAPPTNLPNNKYMVPQVEEKENFVPAAVQTFKKCNKGKCKTITTKVVSKSNTTKTTTKNGKKVVEKETVKNSKSKSTTKKTNEKAPVKKDVKPSTSNKKQDVKKDK